MDADRQKLEHDIGLLTQAICLLTTHASTLVRITEDVGVVMRRTSEELHALQTAVLGVVDLVECLQRRVDVLERRQASPLYAVGRVQ